MKITFDKMEGAGNDFILIDNRSGEIPDASKNGLVVPYCRRGQGIGADGVIFLQPDAEFDFSWDFYNSDGSKAEMCGNGARCVARFAHKIGAAGRDMTFRTIAGPIKATLTERGAKVQLADVRLPAQPLRVRALDLDLDTWFLNSGVPHAVIAVDDVASVAVKTLGAAVRHHERFAPAGTNVDFFMPRAGGGIVVRTYERGVEGETLACGTGAVATAIVASFFFGHAAPVTVLTRGGEELKVYFTITEETAAEVFLEGGARLVFSGWFDAPDL